MKLDAMNTNFETLTAIADASIKTLDASNRTDAKRWINAIRKGLNELQENCYWQYADGALLLMSSTSGAIRTANGTCYDDKGEPCKAFAQSQPCRHRAAARLLARYAETA